MTVMRGYHWPGNVRELQNLVERLMIMVPGEEVTLADIPYPINPNRTGDNDREYLKLKEAREFFEKNHIQRVIRITDGNISHASELLGIERSHLYRKLRQYGIDTGEARQNPR